MSSRDRFPWSLLVLASLLVLPAGVSGCGDDSAPVDASIGIDASQDGDGGADREDAGERDDGGTIAVDSGPPDAGREPCDTPGALEEDVPCGNCGTTTRFCTAGRVWEYSACSGEGECVPGTSDTEACGNCGTQPRRCTASCTWMVSGECSGEGVCMPGTTSRSGEGCPAGQQRELECTDRCTFEPTSACSAEACDTPGRLEDVPCGMCGTRERFCTLEGVWQYEPCLGEGVCMPGTSGSQACGMCGTQTTRCTESCTWSATGTCGGEGVCEPGTTFRTESGCPAGQTRLVQCSAGCGIGTQLEACTTTRPVDVLFLVDYTASNSGQFQAQRATFGARCVTPLLALDDVYVGLAFYGDLGSSPEPFVGGVELNTGTAAQIESRIATQAWIGGGDDSTFEALTILTGGTPHAGSVPFTCSAGRVAGGCWRSGAERVIVMHTDEAARGGPMATGSTLWNAWPSGASWTTVRPRLVADGTYLMTWLDEDYISTGDPLGMYRRMATDLGQPMSDVQIESPGIGPLCDALVVRVQEIAGL